MNTFCRTAAVIVCYSSACLLGANPALAADSGCISCHNGIEDIRDKNSTMMIMIKSISATHGDPEGCVLRHGGDPTATEADQAHQGSPQSLVQFRGPQTFYPDPGAMDINQFTCGQSACHMGYEERLEKSLMEYRGRKNSG